MDTLLGDVLRGQIIGVQLTSLKHRSAQIIQSYIRGMITRAQETTKFSKDPNQDLLNVNYNRKRLIVCENIMKKIH